ncbi:MAG: 6,7-dimethyl-8-ribityllumazine synthase [Candidatus Marinimicrobia bacterium]|nr:6,7-dimethyl-8-ribityllumazine synthase [Candidatus Neomarinimicrobiota bacterium]
MMKSILGNLDAKKIKIVIIFAKYNSIIVNKLLDGALDAFDYYQGDKKNIILIQVPGAFEIPGVINQVMDNIKTDCILALGSIIRGGTPHFDYVAGESSNGIAFFSKTKNIPVINGILTTDNIEQALERAGTKAGNKGWELMETAIETSSIYKQIQNN